MLVTQGETNAITISEFVYNKWSKVTTLCIPGYQLQMAFSYFVIASHSENNNVRLFEASSEMPDKIVTQLDLSDNGRLSRVDSSFED